MSYRQSAKTSTNGHGNGNGKHPGPTKERPAPDSAGPFGMVLFLLSLAVLFLASLVAYIVIRAQAAEWPPPDFPAMPRSLWTSTGVILLGSVTIQMAVSAARKAQLLKLQTFLSATLLLSLVFLGTQTTSWITVVAQSGGFAGGLYAYLFYFLTGLHALHVLGGVVPLVVVTVNAFYGRVSFLETGSVRYCAMYWHFLGGVWITLFGMLVLTT